jgi:hypothetical protein
LPAAAYRKPLETGSALPSVLSVGGYDWLAAACNALNPHSPDETAILSVVAAVLG